MSVVKSNAIQVAEGEAEELKRRFAARTQRVDHADGFEEFMLLRPVKGRPRHPRGSGDVDGEETPRSATLGSAPRWPTG